MNEQDCCAYHRRCKLPLDEASVACLKREEEAKEEARFKGLDFELPVNEAAAALLNLHWAAQEPTARGVLLRWRGYGDGKPVLMPAEEMDAMALAEAIGSEHAAREHIRRLVARSRHWKMKIRRWYDRIPGLMSAIILMRAALGRDK